MSRQHAYSREELLATARGELFSHSNARLPNDPMLMFDRITEIYADGGSHGKGIVNAELDIRPDLWFFGCHFLGDPVMLWLSRPGRHVATHRFFLTWSGATPGYGRALGCGEVKFTGQVLPNAKLVRYEVEMTKIINRTLVIGQANARMLVDNREIYFAKDLRVGMFNNTESF